MMRTFFRRLSQIILLGLLVAIGYLFWFFYFPPHGTGELKPKGAAGLSPTEAAIPLKNLQLQHERIAPIDSRKILAANSLSKQAVSTYQLPPLGNSFLHDEAQLRAESEQGHGRATCLIAHEQWMCQYFYNNLFPIEEKLEARRLRQNLSDQAVIFFRDTYAAQEKRCAGMDIEKLRDEKPWKVFLQAGLQGHVASMMTFTLAPGMADDPIAAVMDTEWATAYKTYAPGFLYEGARYGNVIAIKSLIEAHGGGISNHPLLPINRFKLFDKDELVTLRYAFVLAHFLDPNSALGDTSARALIAKIKEQTKTVFSETEIAAAKSWGDGFYKSALEKRAEQRYTGALPPEIKNQEQGNFCYR